MKRVSRDSVYRRSDEMAAKRFFVRQDENGTFQLKGELTIHELKELRDFLDRSLEEQQQIVVSLAGIRFVDTAVLQLLIAYKRRFGSETRVRISDVSAEVEEILSLSGLRTALM